MGSVVNAGDFQHIIRVLNTNVDGKQKVMYALTKIRGVGRRFSNQACRAAEVDMNKRAGELTAEELDTICAVIANPLEYNVPKYFLNSQFQYKTGEFTQLTTSAIDGDMRDTMERLKKMRIHRGIRHFWGLKVRGQHTCSTGRGRSAAKMAARGGK